eukprot:3392296-Prymnesium_polylepis.1
MAVRHETGAAPAWREPTATEVLSLAAAEGLTLIPSQSQMGFKGVYEQGRKFIARLTLDGKLATLGTAATAEGAALLVARHYGPEASAAEAEAAATPVRPTEGWPAEEARQLAAAEGLTLIPSQSQTGFKGVYAQSQGGKFRA